MGVISKYPVLNFSGGVRRDKGLFELDKNELLDCRNIQIDQRGRVNTRRGSQRIGGTLSGVIDNSFFFSRSTGSASTNEFLVATRANPTVLSRLFGTKTTAAVATTDVTISVTSTTGFAASGSIEIDGDQISYTGVTATSFTGVTSISTSHVSGAAVHQWVTLAQTGTEMNGTGGIYFAVLGATVFMSGIDSAFNMKSWDTTTMTTVASPSIIFNTYYRDSIYGAGSGVGGANGNPKRVFFCDRGDGTTWLTSANSFDVNDQNGERISGLRVFSDYLGIFKTNSIFTYDEIELKQRIVGVGAYNHHCVQELNGLLYTFCPAGVFKTDLFSAKQIGNPVREYWESFQPKLNTTLNPLIQNTLTWTFLDSFFIFLDAITSPVSATGVVLEYNTKTEAWVVHDGIHEISHMREYTSFKFGDSSVFYRPGLWGGKEDGHVLRFNENVYRNTSSTGSVIGGDIPVDHRDDTGDPISSYIETSMIDFDNPNLWKNPKYLRIYTEQGQWTVSYRIENEAGISAYTPLGTVSKKNEVIRLPKELAGYRVGLKISSVNTVSTATLNGFVFEEIETSTRTTR